LYLFNKKNHRVEVLEVYNKQFWNWPTNPIYLDTVINIHKTLKSIFIHPTREHGSNEYQKIWGRSLLSIIMCTSITKEEGDKQ
jgi:hypothetical protein